MHQHWSSSVLEGVPMRNAYFGRLESMKKVCFWRTSNAKCYIFKFGSDFCVWGAFIFWRTSNAKCTFSKFNNFTISTYRYYIMGSFRNESTFLSSAFIPLQKLVPRFSWCHLVSECIKGIEVVGFIYTTNLKVIVMN